MPPSDRHTGPLYTTRGHWSGWDFWDDAKECARHCLYLLADEPRRQAIAAAGHRWALRNNHFNEPVMQRIIDTALGA